MTQKLGTQKITYFPDRGCTVHTLLSLYVYATVESRSYISSTYRHEEVVLQRQHWRRLFIQQPQQQQLQLSRGTAQSLL